MRSAVAIETIKAFQRAHANHLGEPLRVDGDMGMQTAWAMDLDTLSAERQDAVRRAQLHLNLVEIPAGSNTDPAGIIRSWQLLCNAPLGSAWCAAFACFCLDFEVTIAGAQALGKQFPAAALPMAGDLVWWPTTGWQGHIELILGVSSFELMTIGGNVGNRVRCVRRVRQPFMKFARVYTDATGRGPGVVHNDLRVPLLPASAATR
ncbi:MAG: hypothetical protein RL685_1559 [Pseudomonadota bacterium]|jgi:hypothetical protein